MENLNENQQIATSFYQEITKYAFGLRNSLLIRVYDYFRKHNYPIQDLADLAGISRTSLYTTISKYRKEEKNDTDI